MDTGKPIFAQIMDFLPTYEFHQCVRLYHGHYKIKSFSCWDQFLCMAFAQIWIAITVYVLVAIVKKQLKLDQSLYTILQILSVTLFEKTPILEALSIIQPQESEGVPCNQLTLFD